MLLGAFGVLSVYEPLHVHLITTNVPSPNEWQYYYRWYWYHEWTEETLGARIPPRYGCVKQGFPNFAWNKKSRNIPSKCCGTCD